MKENEEKLEPVDFTNLLGSSQFNEEPYKFPYENYKIIGDTAEIDKIISTCGFINIDAVDIESTLSTATANYVSVGLANDKGSFAGAMKDALSKLPINQDSIARMLFNIWIPRNAEPKMSELSGLLESLPADVDFIWGVAYDDSLQARQVKITLIATSK